MTEPERFPANESASVAVTSAAVASSPVAPGGVHAAGGETLSTPTSGMAIASLVFGILGVVAVSLFAPFAILPAVPAVVFGYLAQGTIGRSRGQLGGAALAKAGMILGYVGIGFGLLVTFLFALFFGGIAVFFSMSAPMSPGPIPMPPAPTPVPAPAEEGIPLVEGEEEAFEEVELWETSPESEAHEGEGEDGAGVGGEDAEPLEAEPAPVVEPEAGLEAEPEAVPDEPSPGSQE